jgi:3,4-dihydroxy 2-butanone 4-phosphate synthase/GTP cyclohydrolase II
VTTGISAADRARTIQVAVNKGTTPDDLVQPGHIFPLRAQKGGVLMRAGHTEAGCDLTEMAGLTPASVICEIIKEDGTMARLPDLIAFAQEHNLKIGTIADLIHYRSQNESLVEQVAERPLNTPYGEFKLVAFRDKPSGAAHLALVHGELSRDKEALVRVHQPVSILDVLGNCASTHSWDLASAMKAIRKGESGAIVLLNCGETADQLFAQFAPRESGPRSARAASMDLRTYGIGAQILRKLGVGKMQLLANPRKMPSMTGFDLEVTGYLPQPAE